VTTGRIVGTVMVVGLIGAAGFGAWTFAASSGPMAGDGAMVIPTEVVSPSNVALDVYLEGELRAAKSVAVPAPSVGGALRLLSLMPTGTVVTAGDPVMEFDPGEQQYALEQALSELAEAEQEIAKREADVAAQLAQDQVTLLTARFDVRRAELDANIDPELMPANDIKIRQLSLEEAKRRLTQTEQDVTSRETTAKSGLAVLGERRAKAQLGADRARQNLETLTLRAPVDGVVVVRENRDASGGIIFSGMSLPEWRAGDTAFAGRPMFDVFDPGGMEIRATVNEQERTNLSVGQAVEVELKSAAGAARPGKIVTVGGLGRGTQGPLRLFDVVVALDQADESLRPGTTVNIIARGQTLEHVLSIPKHALFEKDGKSHVYRRGADGFALQEVRILHRTESRVVIEGVEAGDEIALVDPTRAPGKTGADGGATEPSAPATPGGGR
jgi:multidrug resistance efflux pump